MSTSPNLQVAGGANNATFEFVEIISAAKERWYTNTEYFMYPQRNESQTAVRSGEQSEQSAYVYEKNIIIDIPHRLLCAVRVIIAH